MFKQYRITAQDYSQEIPDAVLDSADPIHEMKALAGLNGSGLGGAAKLQEYTANQTSTEGSNCSETAMEKVNYQKNNNVQPGTPEWFKLWFSLPYMTGEKPW
jgi:hypothetical protein